MALLFYSEDDDPKAWQAGLNAHLPGLDFRFWPNIGDPADIDMALVWKPQPGMLAELPNLAVIFSLAAGVDALVADPTLPDLPLVRMIDPSLTRGMSEFILYHVLRYYRGFDVMEAQQRHAEWRLVLAGPAREFTVGIMGLGELGLDAVSHLRRFDFDLWGWSRSAKTVEGVRTFAGRDQIGAFLTDCDAVVCLLPLTPETENMLNSAFFAAMKRGSRLIHAGRGGQLVVDDLLAALESGHLAGAAVDVTPVEPLAAEERLWRHPKVMLTPHAASYVKPATGAAELARNITRFRRGEALSGLVDRSRGY